MTKKKSARSTSDKPAKKRKATESASTAKTISNEQIGEVAGEIWHLLSTSDGQTLTAVKKSIEAPADLVSASIGWLAREGKLEFAKSGRSVKLNLR